MIVLYCPAFYKGMTSPLIGNAPMNAIVFGCNGNMNRLLYTYSPRTKDEILHGTPRYWQIYISAAYAGAAQCIVCTPVELIKCKLQVQSDLIDKTIYRYKGPLDCLRYTYNNFGIFGLYRGFVTTFWRDAPSYGVWFVVYEWVKHTLTPRNEKSSVSAMLTAGSAAGVATWVCTYPMDVIVNKNT
jgi:solute carrier family 25 carnitine/acylcarnitine transporter 20/29